MTNTTHTSCPYCGVGCGVIASRIESKGEGDNTVTIQGDPQHPANFGRLCSKGSSLQETLVNDDRFLHPEINGTRCDWQTATDHIATRLSDIIQQHGKDSVAFYVSGQLLTEDYYVANKLMKGFIGSANIDTNSRLCMSSTVAGYKRAFGSDTVPCSYEDLERAKLIVLTGSNTAWCHPVLFQRISKAKQDNPDLQIVVIDPRQTSTCDIADLHLAIAPGRDSILFNGLLSYLHQHDETNDLFVAGHTEQSKQAIAFAMDSAPDITSVARQCSLDQQDVQRFYKLFARTERVVTVFSQGINQSTSGTDKVNAIINCHLLTGRIGRPGCGPFSFTGQPNAMGGREVGGLANQLAAHMELDNPAHQQLVQDFWQSPVIANKEGLMAVDMFDAVARGKIKAIWIMGTNPVVSMPNANKIRDALKTCELVIVSDCVRHTDTTACANVLLPAQPWGEKDGTVTNSERCISRQRAFLPATAEAKPDWWIICEVAKRMGFQQAFDYHHAHDIFIEHATLSGINNNGTRDFDISPLATLDKQAYDALQPIQWPVTVNAQNEIVGTRRMFSTGRFYTPSGRARFIPIQPRDPLAKPINDRYPLILNTGRIRDQWHTMTRTGKVPRLNEHSPEPYAELHPVDAKSGDIQENNLIKISSEHGDITVRARIISSQQQGSVFVPMHWNDQFSVSARVNTLMGDETDPLSGQPGFKQTAINIERCRPTWFGFLLSRRQLTTNNSNTNNSNISGSSYWSKITGNGFYRYELAGEQDIEDWPSWARGLLCTSAQDINWVEYLDKAARRYRGARLIGNRVESCIFIAPSSSPSHELPPRSWLASLFEKDELSSKERNRLLSGQPPDNAVDTGPVVCACFNVGLNTLNAAIDKQNLTSVEAIGQLLKAGTNCGSCIPELRSILEKYHTEKNG